MLSPISRVRTVVSRTALALFATLAVASATNAQETPEITATLPATTESNTVQVLVEFFGEPAARSYGLAFERDKPRGTSAATASAVNAGRSQITSNRSEQSRVIAEIAKSGVNRVELYRATRAVNGVAYQIARADIDRLRKVKGVKSVHIIEPEFLNMSTTVPFLGVPAVWSGASPLGVTGQGVRIGIIDTGVDYQHAMFGGTGALADYQANPRTTNTAGPTTFFPTPAVVGGFDFAGDAYTGNNAPAPDPNPMDCNGHGTHVASTAAGRGVRADGTPYTGPYDTTTDFTAANLRIGPGVAPNAQIYALRVFGCTGSTTLTNAAIEWALDPNGDNDMSDHLDVINMSLGSNFGSLASTSAIAADNAARMGMIVVASAGNAGDTYTISGAPGSGQRVIATAATGDNGLPGASLTINAPASIAGSYAASAAPAALTTVAPNGQMGDVVLVNDGSVALPGPPPATTGGTVNDGCQTPYANAAAVAGKIALVDRGGCGFADKIANAQANGAIGVIIANNVAGNTPPGLGGSLATPATIPTVSVTQTTGASIKARLAASDTVNVTFVAANLADTLASFSSRGPRGDGGLTGVKPDLAAPGLAITAAQTGITCLSGNCQRPDASGYVANSQPLVLQGTSMAAPHAAGMMALLKERYPDRSSEEMKAIAMNTSVHDVYQFAGNVNRIGVDRAGAGRIDAEKAVEATVSAFNADEAGAVSLSFVGEVVGTQTQTKRLRVVNYASTAQTFNLAIDTAVDAPGMSFSLPGGSSVTVPANGTVFVDVRVSATASQMRHVRDVSADPSQSAPGAVAGLGTLPRHYITNESGYVNFSQGANKVLRVPIYAALRPASTMSAPDTLATGNAPTGSSTIPLSGNDVCTGTLGAGPSCTGTFPTDDVSLVSAFELHAIGPKKTNIPGYANIRHVGVSFDPVSGLYLFAVSAWGNWGSPTDVAFNVSVDNNEDGTFDRVLFNTNPGTLSTIAGTTATGQDVFITSIVNTATSGLAVGGAGLFVNRFSAAAANSALFNSNVMFLAATPAQLGLTAGDTTFRYKVETCPGFNPFCTTKIDSLPGPFTWNSAAQGLNFNGSHALFDLNGATIPVTWNTANMATNGSIGGLLLHHHNTSGNRAEVFAVEGTATADLGVSQSISGSATIGQQITVTVTANHISGAAATGVSVSNLLPPGLTYVSDDSGGAYASGSGAWTIGNLTVGASATLNIVAQVATAGAITIESQVAGALIDPVPENDFASTTLNVSATSTITASVTAVTPAPSLAMSNANFDVTVQNTGSETLFNIEVVATPATTPPPLSPAPQTFNIASLAAGTSTVIPVTVVLPNMVGNYVLDVAVNAENGASVTASASLAVISPASVGATKTVSSGPYTIGSTVTYAITLTNSVATSQQNNPGDELVDILPAGLTLVSANSSSGTAVATTATNTVTWNGAIAGNSSVTVNIVAQINAGTEGATISNQATVNSDADGNGTNETVASTDDPNVAGAANPTNFVVPFVVSAFTKTVSAPSRNLNDVVVYTITIANTANATLADNPGDEMVDVLPPGLTLLSVNATGGSAVADLGTNTVTWNGTLAPSANVVITIEARINANGAGQNVINQARLNFDGDLNGSNESVLLSDDPNVAGAANATAFNVAAQAVPLLGSIGLAALASLLLGLVARRLQRRERP
jgi:uncharacterized repeat protein (TIGR01451 family)